MKKRALLFICLGILITHLSAHAAAYRIDPDHSTIGFKIRHLVSQTQGTFGQFEGLLDYDPGHPEGSKAEAAIQAASIDTNVPARDKHLRSADFFDVEKFPTITFKSTELTDATQESAKLHGILNMHGVEKTVVIDLAIHGVGKDPWGNVRAGFTGTVKLNRRDFGLDWNKALETGGFLVGDEVDVTLEIEGILKQ